MNRIGGLAAALALAAACSQGGTDAPDDQDEAPRIGTVTGSLTYRERIALPPQTEALVDVVAAPGGPVIASSRFGLEGRQVPVAFELDVAIPSEGAELTTQAAFLRGGEVAWLSEPVGAVLNEGRAALGEIRMRRFDVGEVTARFTCGEVEVGFAPGGLQPALVVGDETFALRQLRSASGARYAAIGVTGTEFATKGEGALVTIRGERLAPCTLVADPEAQGAALTGAEWVVESINGARPVGDEPVTIAFSEDGRVSGNGTCNRYSGSYSREGDVLSFGALASTMMACPRTLLEQERRFLEVMGSVRAVSIGEDGTLTLTTDGGGRIIARRN